MMRLSAERLWLIGGVVAVVALFAVGWFFAISPQYDQAASLNDQAATTDSQVTQLQHRIAELRKQNENLPTYLATLAKQQAALPSTSGLSDLLRELQGAGDVTGAAVSGVSVGGVVDVSAGGSKLYALPLTMTVTGSVSQLREFLNQLQQVQPRAVLITSASLSTSVSVGSSAAPGSKATTSTSSLSLSMKAFVAASSAAAATPTTSASPSAAASPSRSG
jgi:Tfp pilus assembly protein PilO